MLDILFCIIKFDDNSVVKHEVVFLFGMLHDYLKQFEDEITKELIFVCQHEQSIVLHHEIIETFGHFTNDLAIEFVEKSLTSDNNDILDTAKISKGRQEYEISKKKAARIVESKNSLKTTADIITHFLLFAEYLLNHDLKWL